MIKCSGIVQVEVSASSCVHVQYLGCLLVGPHEETATITRHSPGGARVLWLPTRTQGKPRKKCGRSHSSRSLFLMLGAHTTRTRRPVIRSTSCHQELGKSHRHCHGRRERISELAPPWQEDRPEIIRRVTAHRDIAALLDRTNGLHSRKRLLVTSNVIGRKNRPTPFFFLPDNRKYFRSPLPKQEENRAEPVRQNLNRRTK